MANQTIPRFGAISDQDNPATEAVADIVYNDTNNAVRSVIVRNGTARVCKVFAQDVSTNPPTQLGADVAPFTTSTFNAPNNRYFVENDPVMGWGPVAPLQVGIALV